MDAVVDAWTSVDATAGGQAPMDATAGGQAPTGDTTVDGWAPMWLLEVANETWCCAGVPGLD